MEIRELAQETYAGRKFTARYQTHGYYDIRAAEDGFRVEYRPFTAPEERSFEDVFFGEWLEDPMAFGAFEDGELLGYVEGSPETWNRRRGIGTALMDTIAKAADASGARMLVLETQSCNERAIAFYRKNGFSVIGFDLYAYSNRDPERHEVRVEMGKRLDQAGISG